MPASIMDLFRKATSGTRPEPANLTALKSIGASSINLNTTTGWPTDTGVDFIMYRVDSNGKVIPGTQTDWVGTTSGTTINNLSLKAGTDQQYMAGAQTVVIAAATASWANSLVSGLLNQHSQSGAHGNITATGYSQPTGAFSVPAGAIASAALAGNKVSRSNNGTNVTETIAKIQSGWVGSTATGTTNSFTWIPVFPVAFSGPPIVVCSFGGDQASGTLGLGNGNDSVQAGATAKAYSVSNTGFSIRLVSTGSSWSINNVIYVHWIAIGV